jgi:hypothetical protein
MTSAAWPGTVTDARDGRDHLVRDEELDVARTSARCTAACGEEIVPAPLVVPPAARCVRCTAIVADGRKRDGRRWPELLRRHRTGR